ncbi:hypothetical protein [uncultured Ilyobacter sp.]|uniref:hypothetical protein n=1 Tax=uncultured Ilyobacter sp. TaxID=544433 RepID=UPI0029C0260A|nr:hypothetical protein [uncultured Ilyobacter sp.]
MKTIVQLFGKDLNKVPDVLRKIADEIENGKTDSSCLEDEYCYDYLIEEESYYRKFLVYSNDEIIGLDGKNRKEAKILGIAFGSCPHEAFENFYVKDKKLKNIVVREILGNPAYKNLKE